MRKTQVVVIILLGGAVAAVMLWFMYVPPGWQRVIDRCTDYDPHWLGMLDCYGLISIWRPDNSGYLVLNNKRPGAIIAQIKAADAFIVQGNEMYVIDTTPVGACAIPSRGKYCADFQLNGEPKEFG
jgi:hypothetical protein